MPKLLTKRKAKWVQARRTDIVRGDSLNPNAGDAVRYDARLQRAIDSMTSAVESEIKAMFETDHAQTFFAQDASTASQARMLTNALMKKFNDAFAGLARSEAERMAYEAAKTSSRAVHSSMEQLSGGLSLPTSAITGDVKEILNATITENVGLIKSISQQYLTQVQGAVMRSITSGNGLQDLVPFLEKQKGITKRRARVIALDQTRKAFNNLSKGRMENLGLKKFEWLHTGGSNEPRKLHQEMNGKIYSFDDLPVIDENTGERGIPGQAINCRCRMRPVIEFED